jgi:hypothetical protein
MKWRRLASALGAGSIAITSKPRARNNVAQLAPITPVPTTAIRRIGLLKDMILVFLSSAHDRYPRTGGPVLACTASSPLIPANLDACLRIPIYRRNDRRSCSWLRWLSKSWTVLDASSSQTMRSHSPPIYSCPSRSRMPAAAWQSAAQPAESTASELHTHGVVAYSLLAQELVLCAPLEQVTPALGRGLVSDCSRFLNPERRLCPKISPGERATLDIS